MTLPQAPLPRRAALCALVLGALCAGAGRPRHPRSSALPHLGHLVTGRLSAAQQLQVGRVRPSDLVGLWQSVLWADGYAERTSVTCRYDAATSAVTRVWQSNHRLSPDGIVGAATWGVVAQRMVPAGRWTVYLGERHGLPLRQAGDGSYEVYDAGRLRPLRTDAATLKDCR